MVCDWLQLSFENQKKAPPGKYTHTFCMSGKWERPLENFDGMIVLACRRSFHVCTLYIAYCIYCICILLNTIWNRFWAWAKPVVLRFSVRLDLSKAWFSDPKHVLDQSTSDLQAQRLHSNLHLLGIIAPMRERHSCTRVIGYWMTRWCEGGAERKGAECTEEISF